VAGGVVDPSTGLPLELERGVGGRFSFRIRLKVGWAVPAWCALTTFTQRSTSVLGKLGHNEPPTDFSRPLGRTINIDRLKSSAYCPRLWAPSRSARSPRTMPNPPQASNPATGPQRADVPTQRVSLLPLCGAVNRSRLSNHCASSSNPSRRWKFRRRW